jgi:hypothetical protein
MGKVVPSVVVCPGLPWRAVPKHPLCTEEVMLHVCSTPPGDVAWDLRP